MNPLALPTEAPAAALILLAWTLVWKGLALWRSARLDQKYWFVALLVVNTFGLLEIAYLFFFAKEKMKLDELMFWNKPHTPHHK
jgi:hypothetical protein